MSFLPVYFKSINLTGWEIGILMAISPLVSFLVSFPIGMMNDNFDSRRLVMISMLLLSFNFFTLIFIKDFWFLLILFIIVGVSANLWELSLRTIVLKTISKLKKGTELGLYIFIGIMGTFLGLLIGGYLLENLNFGVVFMVSGFGFLLLALYSKVLKKTKTSVTSVKQYIGDLKNKNVIWLAILYFVLTLHWGPEKTSLVLFLTEDVGLTLFNSGILLAFAVLFLAFTAYLFGKRYEQNKLNLKTMLVFGLLLSSIGSIGWYFTLDPLPLFLLRVVHEIGDGAFMIFILLEITDIFKKKRIGGNSSFITLVGVLGGVTGTVIAGGLGDIYGNAFPIFISGLLSLAALLIVPKLDFSHHLTKR